VAFALLGCFLFWGHLGSSYIVPVPKELGRWVETRGPVRGPVTLPVRWGDRAGTLYVGGVGRSALALDGELPQSDPGPASHHPLAALWLVLDLFTAPTVEDLAATVTQAGLDLGRSGYARAPASGDGVAITVGARGEGEPDLPQVHFARQPVWPVLARAGGQEVQIGGAGPQGWPLWLSFGEGRRLEITGPPSPAPSAPPWAVRGLTPEPAAPLLPDWRRAFEGARP